MRSGGKKHSKFGRGKGNYPREQKQFEQIRLAKDIKLKELLRIVESNPQLHQFYLGVLSTFRVSGKINRLNVIRQALEETKQFTEQNNIPWRL